MKKILYVAPFCDPHMADGGSRRSLNLLLQILKEFSPVLLTYPSRHAADLQAWAHDHQIPLEWLVDIPWKKSRFPFISRWLTNQPTGLANFDRRGIAKQVQEVNQRTGGSNLVYFGTQLTGQAITFLPASVRTLLDLYDIYSPIEYKKAHAVSPLRPYGLLFRLEARRMASEERRLIRKATQTLVVSKEDLHTVQQLAPGSLVAVVPNGAELPALYTRPSGSQMVLMIASFYYAPNKEGLRWFLEKSWPSVRLEKPGAKLVVVGQGSEAFQSSFFKVEGVEFVGRVPDIVPYYKQASCAIAPILEGGGSRLKILEAMAHCLPIVSTPFGAEGIECGDSLWIADQPGEFTRAVVHCLDGGPAVDQKASQARKIIETRYSWDGIGSRLRAILHEVAA